MGMGGLSRDWGWNWGSMMVACDGEGAARIKNNRKKSRTTVNLKLKKKEWRDILI